MLWTLLQGATGEAYVGANIGLQLDAGLIRLEGMSVCRGADSCVCIFPTCTFSHLDSIQLWNGSHTITVDKTVAEPELACVQLALSHGWLLAPSHTYRVLFSSTPHAEWKLWSGLGVSFLKFVPEFQITFPKASLPLELKITSGLKPLCLKVFPLRDLDVQFWMNRNSVEFVSSADLTSFQKNLGKYQGSELPSPKPNISLVQQIWYNHAFFKLCNSF